MTPPVADVCTVRGIPRPPDSIERATERFRSIVARAAATVEVEDRRLGIADRKHRTKEQEWRRDKERRYQAAWLAKKRARLAASA